MIGQRLHAVADRVPRGLVASRRQQDEERPDLLLGQALAVDRRVDQHRREVVGRLPLTEAGEILRQRGELLAGLQDGRDRQREIGDVLGIGRAENHVGAVEDVAVLARRDAHHVADDLEWQHGGDVGDEIAATTVDHGVDDLHGGALDVGHHVPETGRREAVRDDPSEARVPRVVHGDHRSEELGKVLWLVDHVHAAACGREELPVPTRLEDVRMAGERPEARSLAEPRHLGLLVERDGALAPQHRECALAVGAARHPELGIAETDVVE
jgi:hypothetical protein